MPEDRMEVRLIVLGYTTAPWSKTGDTYIENGGTVTIGEMYVAEVLATNCGSVPVELRDGMLREDLVDPYFARQTSNGLPAVLRPGEIIAIKVTPPSDAHWRTALLYQRHSLWDRLSAKASATGNETLQAAVSLCMPSAERGVARTGWVTDTLRDAMASGNFLTPQSSTSQTGVLHRSRILAQRFHITAPAPEPTEMIERLRRQK
jgi:hypothetical protein